MNTEKPTILNRLVVPALILIFTAPMLVSWLLINHTDYGISPDTGHHGDLILPPRPIENLSLTVIADSEEAHNLHGKWTIAYLSNDGCNEACSEVLLKMRQIRLATGKYSLRIQRLVVFNELSEVRFSPNQKEAFKGQLIFSPDEEQLPLINQLFQIQPNTNPDLTNYLFVIDPLGNLMMRYEVKTEPAGIIKDLKRLLRYSRIG